MEGRWCTFSLSPVPILDPPILPKVSHGKPLLPADDSTSDLIKKIKFIQSDLPRPSSDLFCVSGHPAKNSFAISGRLFSILVSCPWLQDGTQLIIFFLIFSHWAYMSCSFLGFLPIWLPFQDLLPPPILKCRYLPRIFPWFFIPWQPLHFSHCLAHLIQVCFSSYSSILLSLLSPVLNS